MATIFRLTFHNLFSFFLGWGATRQSYPDESHPKSTLNYAFMNVFNGPTCYNKLFRFCDGLMKKMVEEAEDSKNWDLSQYR